MGCVPSCDWASHVISAKREFDQWNSFNTGSLELNPPVAVVVNGRSEHPRDPPFPPNHTWALFGAFSLEAWSLTEARSLKTEPTRPWLVSCRSFYEGLMIVGVPSNDFGGQEPGNAAEILKAAHDDYGTSFPLADKARVRGEGLHPFYKWAAAERPLDTPRWNFHKYLIGHDGRIAAVFPTAIEPMDARVLRPSRASCRGRNKSSDVGFGAVAELPA
jgi:hypothetical protein